MTTEDKQKRLSQIEEAIAKITNKEANLYFMIVDTKGNPNGAVEYVYSLAYGMKEEGYNVTMLHQEKEFIGVGEWLGKKYADLPHKNVETENVEISVSDFLFIPEFLSSVLGQIKKIPCKKIGILCNKLYLTDVFPFQGSWTNLDVRDIITSTEHNKEFLNVNFPDVKVHVIPPVMMPCFRQVEGKLQKPTVNAIIKSPTDLNYIVKTFVWKYPKYAWVSFKDLRGFPQETMSDMLRDSAITIWVDRDTNFGYPVVESVKCGSITVALVPNEPKAWMIDKEDDGALTKSVLWATTLDEIVDLVAAIIDKWVRDDVPAGVYENQKQLAESYSGEEFEYNIKNILIRDIIDKRSEALKEVYGQLSAAEVEDSKE